MTSPTQSYNCVPWLVSACLTASLFLMVARSWQTCLRKFMDFPVNKICINAMYNRDIHLVLIIENGVFIFNNQTIGYFNKAIVSHKMVDKEVAEYSEEKICTTV